MSKKKFAKNKKIAKILYKIEEFLEIKGTRYKPKAYRKAAQTLESLKEDVALVYEKKGAKGLQEIPAVGKSIAKKIEEYLKTNKIKYFQELKKETAIRQIVTHYFKTKDLSLEKLKKSAKKREIIYSRHTRPAKQLLELAGSIEQAKRTIDIVAEWAKSRNLDYSIETVFKKWLELDRLKPKEIIKKPYFEGNLMIWSETRKRWYVVSPEGEWLEFDGQEDDIEWRVVK